MTRRLCALGLLALSGLVPASAQQINQPNAGSAIRVSVDRINVGVTVTDSHGRSVQGLRREDFHVFDNGVEQPISGFVRSEEPAQLVFLIENSTADYFLAKLGKSPFAGADNLLNNISAIDQVAIVTYSQGAQLLLDFTPDKAAVGVALQSASTESGSGWVNLSSSLAATIDWLASVPGTKIILILSTGLDTSPPESWQLVQQKLKTSDVRILAVSLFGDFRQLPRNKKLSPDERESRLVVNQGVTESDVLLRQLSAATGGHAYFPKNPKDFDRAYGEIAQLVRGQYTLEFVPPAFDGQVHSLKIKTKHFWYHADHRPAYIAPARPSL